MPVVLLFAQAREAAGGRSVRVEGATVAEVVADLSERFGPAMADVVGASRIWVNGDPAEDTQAVGEDDEVAVVPPVSGG
ncbi:MAG: MoaD/ThiS family protein [Microthrixaceae bacterium]